MSRYNVRDLRAPGSGPLTTVSAFPDTRTHEGGPGFTRDAQTELFLRATTTFVGEDSFYERANVSVNRLRDLVATVVATPEGWAWMKGFLPWLREDGNVRTAGILLAAEAVRARLRLGRHGDGNRQLIAAVLRRDDEPCEMIAYWLSRYGKAIPKPIKRGVADKLGSLSERGFLRYDSEARGVRVADVLELVHPRGNRTARAILARARNGEVVNVDVVPGRTWQDDLYRWAITARRGREAQPPASLPAVKARWTLNRLAPDSRHVIARAGLSGELDHEVTRAMAGQWEWLHSWLGDQPADRRAALSKLDQWRLVLPQLGYMALVRNLRNLDQAGLSDADAAPLMARLADPDEVARSRQLPFRFWTAQREVSSLRWGHALETALGHCLVNVPTLRGRSLVLIDTSASMGDRLSRKGTVSRVEAAAMFGLALAERNPNAVDVYGFADGQFAVDGIQRGMSVLRAVDAFKRCVGNVGHGTRIAEAVNATFRRGHHDRVFLFSDMQTFAPGGAITSYQVVNGLLRQVHVATAIPDDVHVFGFNLAGYQEGAIPAGHGNRHELGGLTDHTFALVPMIEAGRTGRWPWLADS